ncbi:hypothetical protein [Embleya sp. NPDC020630]|uniref:hypothetical protein n=1 Tax=Embleya sp. NPDC020630 TaxID=3363979 RepID=UPI00378F508F
MSDTRTLLELLTRRRESGVRPVAVLHDAATTTEGDTVPWCGHSLDRLTRGIDLPAILHRQGVPPDEAVPDMTWYCGLRGYARGSWPRDREWVAIARRVLGAAGLIGGEGRDCPWVLLRDTYDNVHLVASTAAVMEAPRQVDQARVLAECRTIGNILAALDIADPEPPLERGVAHIGTHPEGVATLAYRDESIAEILRDLDWIPAPRYQANWHRTPFGADATEVVDLARDVRSRLVAAGWIVRADPALGLIRSPRAQGRLARPLPGTTRKHAVTPASPRRIPSTTGTVAYADSAAAGSRPRRAR